MHSSALAPKDCAKFARNIYTLIEDLSPEAAADATVRYFGKFMEISKENVSIAKTGGPSFLKSRTAFGVMAQGRGHYSGYAFIVLRGTKASYPADWLTNLNIGVSRTSSGQQVHDGFYQAFLSLRPQLDAFLSHMAEQNIHSLHCVGHSLGGGLATLCADYISACSSVPCYLYTFGAPRVGFAGFARDLSARLSPQQIFRVYHRTDIVPCVPFWPFTHAPYPYTEEGDYFQDSPGYFPAAEYHDMQRYLQTVGSKSWALLKAERPEPGDDKATERWLASREPLSFNVTSLAWLDRAISLVISRVLRALGIAAGGIMSASLTLMDRLAMLLKKGLELVEDIAGMVWNLILRMMAMLGLKPLADKADATVIVIRHVFQLMSARVTAHCQRAIDLVLVNGRSVG